jgi:hypothetical protein
MARGTVLLVSLAVAAASLAGVLLFMVQTGQAQVEQSMCRYLVCAEETLIESGYQAMYRSGPQNARQALEAFREAVRRDAASPDRWCDLAGALTQYGQTEQAGYCYDRAMQLAPNSPQVWLRAANFSFAAGDNQKAVSRYARVLKLTPVYEPVVFSYYGLMGLPLSEILQHGIPAEREVAQAYFRHLLEVASEQEVGEAWRWVTSRSFADDKLAGQYVDTLLGRNRYEDAAAGWKQYLSGRAVGYRQSSYLYNGDFEEEPTGSVFDWRMSPADGVTLELDRSVSRSGRRSLRVELAGKVNLSYGGVAQRTVVRAGTYRFRAYAKTEGLSTDRGLAVRVFDVESPGRLDVRTEELTGTNEWRLLEQTFTAGQGTRLIEVQLSREPSLKFDNKIRGTLWLDGVRLERVEGRNGDAGADKVFPQ